MTLPYVPLPYFPFDNAPYAMSMGTHSLASNTVIEVDLPHYRAELALKDQLLAADERYYLQALPGTEAMIWETIDLLLPPMAEQHPQCFALTRNGRHWRWANRLLGEETTLTLGDSASLPRAPLDWLGRQVQEDLLLLDGTVAGTPLVAGHLCFAAGWCLDDKLGQSFLAIHDPVPLFHTRIGRSSDLLMQRLKPGRPVARINWSLALTDQLDASPRADQDDDLLTAAITPATVGQRVYLRLERQTLTRLPATRAVLFTIHTYLAPLAAVLTDRDRLDRFATTIATLAPEVSAYKGINGYAPALLAYLDERRRALTVAAD